MATRRGPIVRRIIISIRLITNNKISMVLVFLVMVSLVNSINVFIDCKGVKTLRRKTTTIPMAVAVATIA